MVSVEEQFKILVDHKACWAILRNLTEAANYIPGVTKIDIVSENLEGIHAHRQVYLSYEKDPIDEYVEEWIDGTGFTLRLEKNGKSVFPWFNAFGFKYHISKLNSITLCRLTITYTPRIEVFIGLQGIVFDHFLRRELRVIGKRMKTYYEGSSP